VATLTVTHAMLALLGLTVSDLRVVDHPGVGDCDWRLGAVDGWMGA